MPLLSRICVVFVVEFVCGCCDNQSTTLGLNEEFCDSSVVAIEVMSGLYCLHRLFLMVLLGYANGQHEGNLFEAQEDVVVFGNSGKVKLSLQNEV
jgi:hypothetical protein